MQNRHIQEAIQILKRGGIVIYPTDTAFGIGCRIDSRAAVDRLFTIRRRPVTQAAPVLVDSEAMALAYYRSPSYIVRRLMSSYWPGALTIIAPCDPDAVYSPIRGGSTTIGLRQPDHETALELIRGTGVPILGPSANFHGNKTPFRFGDLDPDLVRLVDYAVPGAVKDENVSTVIDTTIVPAVILRQGAVRVLEKDLL